MAALPLAAFVVGIGGGCGDLVLEAGDGGVDGGEADDDGSAVVPLVCEPGRAYPSELGCTGLYADWPKRTLSPTVKEYRPSHELYADGATTSRWVEFPPGAPIDASDPNEWKFPIGTKFWMEFRLAVGGRNRPVETRFLWKTSADSWVRATYAWAADETTASEATSGVQNVGGGDYEIPSQETCAVCHGGRKDFVLGFEPVLLSQPTATGFNYAALQAAGALSSTNGKHTLPGSSFLLPGANVEQNALGYLQANCGVSCHSGKNQWSAVQSAFVLRLDVNDQGTLGGVQASNPVKNGVNKAIKPDGLFASAPPVGELTGKCRILPLAVNESAVHWRMNHRDAPGSGTGFQMPPVGTHVVDPQGVATLASWINSMQPSAGYPAAAAECMP